MAMIDEIRRVASAETTVNPRQLSPLALAQIGDTVCDLYARVYLNDQFTRTPHELHLAASRFVCAAGLAAAFFVTSLALTLLHKHTAAPASVFGSETAPAGATDQAVPAQSPAPAAAGARARSRSRAR